MERNIDATTEFWKKASFKEAQAMVSNMSHCNSLLPSGFNIEGRFIFAAWCINYIDSSLDVYEESETHIICKSIPLKLP